MNLNEITPLILTYNEQANIDRTLAGLDWAQQIVIVDSGSTDSTAELAKKHLNVNFVQRPFENHTSQWNFGLAQIKTPWVLTLDADYVCLPELPEELSSIDSDQNAYRARFRYCIEGRPLRGTLYPPRVILFRVGRFQYQGDGHTQLLDVDEPVGELRTAMLHDDRKPLSRWLKSQAKYADLEVQKLLSTADARLDWKDRLRKQIVVVPFLTLVYCLVCKRLVLDGRAGLSYALQRMYAELLLSLKLLDARLRKRNIEQESRKSETESRAGVKKVSANA
jgi:glycosyltransferase involved in cell wall biosynthesis